MPSLSANEANSKPCPKPRPTEGKLSFMTSQKPKPTGTRLPLSSPQKPEPTEVKLWPTSLVASKTTAEPVRSPIVPIHPVILTPNPPPPKPLTMIKARTKTKPECSTRTAAIISVFCASSKAEWSYRTRKTPAVSCNVRCKATTTGSCAVATTFNSSTICCFSATPPCESKVGAFQALTQLDTPLPGPLQSQVGAIELNSKLPAYMARDNTSSTGQITQLTSVRAPADGLIYPPPFIPSLAESLNPPPPSLPLAERLHPPPSTLPLADSFNSILPTLLPTE